MSDDIRSFEEFWPHYVRAHANKTNRTLHFLGTTAAMGIVAASLLTKRRALLLAAPIAGYGFAWFGHFFVEKNKPATFGHPFWSLQADFKMWGMILRGEMDAEVEKYVGQTNGAGHAEAPDATPKASQAN